MKILPLFAAVAAIAAGAAGFAGAGLIKVVERDAEQVENAINSVILRSPYKAFVQTYRFGEARNLSCASPRSDEPMVRAVIISSEAPDDAHGGTARDIELVTSSLKNRGVPDTAITILHAKSSSNSPFDRNTIFDGLDKALACIKPGDQMVLHLTGNAGRFQSSYNAESLNAGTDLSFFKWQDLINELCKDVEREACENWARSFDGNALIDEKMSEIPNAIFTNLDAGRENLATLSGITNFDISNFITRVRNRGADVFAFIDTCHAAAFRLGELQDIARGKWQARGQGKRVDEKGLKFELVEQPGIGKLVPLERDAGAYAFFYASGVFGTAQSIPDSGTFVGAFTLALSQALQTESTPDVTTLARGIVRAMAEKRFIGSQDQPRFEAAFQGLAMLTPRKKLEANSDDIEIIEPALTRGGSAMPLSEDGPVKIVARFKRPADAALATIDSKAVPMEADGTFSAEIPAVNRNESIVVGVYTHQRQLVTRKISVAPPALPQSFAQTGRRFALLIGNANYEDVKFERLATPQLDVKAVAEVLTRDFGFTTSLPARVGKETSLVLLDARAGQISDTLDALAEELGPEDQLIIYYAGHGIYEEANGMAYWVPVDVHYGKSFGLLAATAITQALTRIKARNILVVSDSCYAGALTRAAGEDALPVSAADRMRALEKMARQTSRVLLTSGGKEPVLDQGGKGHSIFARAFMDALDNMDFDAFSAQELYNRLNPAVSGRAPQQPKYAVIRDSGHAGGDFVFVKMRRPEAAAKK